jgi:hypothetical protein
MVRLLNRKKVLFGAFTDSPVAVRENGRSSAVDGGHNTNRR